MALPERTEAEEEAFVAEWAASDDTELLLEVITEAMEARRPKLAARLVNLLDDHVEIEPGSAIERAQMAARLYLTHETPEDRSWSELEDAWTEARRSRMQRLNLRQRQRMTGRTERIGRLTPRRKR